MKRFLYTLIFSFILFTSYAQVPQTLSFQGVLIDTNSGAPISGTRNFEFKLYLLETGGTDIWSELHPDVDINVGVYNVILGSTNAFDLDPDTKFDQPYYLEVTVGGEILDSRIALTSSGYDLNEHLQDLAIDGSLSGSKVGDGIDAANITTGKITSAQILNSTITSADLATNSVAADEIATDAVGASEIAADAVGASEIAADAVGIAQIGPDAVGTSELSNSVSINTSGIATFTSNFNPYQIVLSSSGTNNSGISMTTPGTYSYTTGGFPITFNWLGHKSDWEISAEEGDSDEDTELTISIFGGKDISSLPPESRTKEYIFTRNSFSPAVDGGSTLGSSALKWNIVYSTNGTINVSDKRKKQNISQLKYGLNTIKLLQPVSFEWKDKTGDVKLGLIAQDLLDVIPEVVDIGNDEEQTLGVYYAELIPVLIKAIQEQQEIIDGLKNTNGAQEASLLKLENSNANLEKRLSIIENYLNSEAKNK